MESIKKIIRKIREANSWAILWGAAIVIIALFYFAAPSERTLLIFLGFAVAIIPFIPYIKRCIENKNVPIKEDLLKAMRVCAKATKSAKFLTTYLFVGILCATMLIFNAVNHGDVQSQKIAEESSRYITVIKNIQSGQKKLKDVKKELKDTEKEYKDTLNDIETHDEQVAQAQAKYDALVISTSDLQYLYDAEREKIQNQLDAEFAQLQADIESKQAQVDTLNHEIESLEAYKCTAKGKGFDLCSGFYEGGEQLPIGYYNITSKKASGNVFIYSSSGSLVVNEIFGGNHGIDRFNNVYIGNGYEIEISGCTVTFTALE